MGFSTGRYDGDMLIVETTHLKQGWIRRNGIPMSDQATMTEYYVRFGDMFTRLIDPHRSGEPDRAARQEPGVLPQPARAARADLAVGVRSGRRDRHA